jgi:cell division protein FtsQ
MLKRINWKLIFSLFVWGCCLTGLVFLMGFIDVKKNAERCKDLKIIIPGTQSLIEGSEVFRIISAAEGSIRNRPFSQLNLEHIEVALKTNPYIEHAKVYADMNGIVWVKITQREPVLHVMNASGQDFYIDNKGLKIPASINFTARVLVANGTISELFTGVVDTLHTPLARDLLAVSQFIRRDSLWDDQVEQLYVNDHGDIELVPLVGDQRIILGNADSLQVKFRNLLAFYKKAMPVVGWDTYKIINIKYANQVVCVRADSTDMAEPVLADSLTTDSLESQVKQTASTQNL